MNMGLYDSAGISPSFIQEYIDILAGVTEKGDTISIIDTNRDMNFGNDTIYYKSSPFLPHTGFIKVDGTEFYYKGQKVKDAIYIKPWFQNAYIQDENGPGLHVGVVISNYKKSTFITCGKRYQFALAADNQAFVFKPYFTKILFAEYPKPFPTEADKNLKPNSIGDTIRLGKAYYRLDSITPFGDALYIRPLKKTSQPIYGFNTGYTARPFQATDFITGQSLSSQSINAQNKYLLIDFWGTWCHPCIKALPDLQQLYQHCKGKNIEMLSVACENTIDTTKLRTAIQEYGIVWHNIAEDKLYKNNPTHQLQRDFRINAYPTILLIAPNGKIIARETGTGGTKKMAEKIKRLLQ
jgi:thiol-disulfide isomerase/thioredoxin